MKRYRSLALLLAAAALAAVGTGLAAPEKPPAPKPDDKPQAGRQARRPPDHLQRQLRPGEGPPRAARRLQGRRQRRPVPRRGRHPRPDQRPLPLADRPVRPGDGAELRVRPGQRRQAPPEVHRPEDHRPHQGRQELRGDAAELRRPAPGHRRGPREGADLHGRARRQHQAHRLLAAARRPADAPHARLGGRGEEGRQAPRRGVLHRQRHPLARRLQRRPQRGRHPRRRFRLGDGREQHRHRLRQGARQAAGRRPQARLRAHALRLRPELLQAASKHASRPPASATTRAGPSATTACTRCPSRPRSATTRSSRSS